jgi:gamma-carbonic anhydrase
MQGTILSYRGVMPHIAADAFIASTAAVIGDVVIGEQSSIWFGCVIRGDVNEVRIGKRTNFQDGSVIHVSKDGSGTYLGDDVTIGHMVLIHAATLEDGCFIGMHATIMDDCVIEAGAMLAAGALLTPGKRVASGTLWAGSPARYIRDLKDTDRRRMAVTGPRYVDLGQEYLGLRTPPADAARG